jgi:hypothetical protein
MSPLTLLSVQSTLSLVAYALLARWYVAPRLAARSREEALVPLLWVQVFRYAPLALYAPGQVDGGIPADVRAAVGYGDLAVGLVALVALLAVRRRARGGIALAWIFSFVGVGDLVFATAKAVGAHMYTYYMGWNWYILTFYVPMLVVSHTLILYYLIRGRSEREPMPRRAAV